MTRSTIAAIRPGAVAAAGGHIDMRRGMKSLVVQIQRVAPLAAGELAERRAIDAAGSRVIDILDDCEVAQLRLLSSIKSTRFIKLTSIARFTLSRAAQRSVPRS